MPQKYLNYINGKWLPSASRKFFKSINPASKGDIVGEVPQSNKADIDVAVKSAQNAFEKWRLVPAPKRGEVMFKAAQLLEKRKSEIGDIVCKEMGKVKAESYGDVQEAIDMLYFMAGEGRRLYGQTMPSELPNKDFKTVREPIGVWALITPWNFPVAIPAWKICPALIAGNTVILKPSRYTPVCATKFIEIFEQAGFPSGVVNLLHGSGPEVGEYLVRHPGIRGVSFTGSTKVGGLIAEWCAKYFKKCSLEMGGKNVQIVLNDANLDLAVNAAIWGGFGTTGQRCTATSRIIVEKDVYDKFVGLFVARAQKLRLGFGLTAGVDVGPLINEEARNKVIEYVKLAIKEKGELVCGGAVPADPKLKNGFFFEPTIFKDITASMKLFTDEVFGPVVGVTKANDLQHAVDLANNSSYGLSSAIFTRNVNAAQIAARDLQTGLVYINAATIGAEIQTPFGGFKHTGNGHREAGGIGGAIDTFTDWKVIATDFSDSIQRAQIDAFEKKK